MQLPLSNHAIATIEGIGVRDRRGTIMKIPNADEYWWLYLIGFGLVVTYWRQLVLLAIVGFTIFVEIGVFSDNSTTFGTKIIAAIIVAAIGSGLFGWIKRGGSRVSGSASNARRNDTSGSAPRMSCGRCGGTKRIPCTGCYQFTNQTCQYCYGTGSVSCPSCP